MGAQTASPRGHFGEHLRLRMSPWFPEKCPQGDSVLFPFSGNYGYMGNLRRFFTILYKYFRQTYHELRGC